MESVGNKFSLIYVKLYTPHALSHESLEIKGARLLHHKLIAA